MSDQDILQAMSASSSIRYQAAQPTATASQPVPVRRASRSTVQEPITRVPRRTVEQPRSRRGGTSEPITRATGTRPTQTQATAQLDLDDEQSAQATVPLAFESEQEQDAEMMGQTTTLLGPDVDTNADIQVRLPVPYRQQARAKHQGKHPFTWIGLTTLAFCLGWLLSTVGASIWVTHMSDPAFFGPTHGNVVIGVFGGGDSAQHPTKLIALVNNGQVEIVKLTANDYHHTQILPGPRLADLNFPDPQNAEVQLEVSDVNHDGHLDVTVHILSSSYDLPFHRFSQSYILYGDAHGTLTAKSQTGGN